MGMPKTTGCAADCGQLADADCPGGYFTGSNLLRSSNNTKPLNHGSSRTMVSLDPSRIEEQEE